MSVKGSLRPCFRSSGRPDEPGARPLTGEALEGVSVTLRKSQVPVLRYLSIRIREQIQVKVSVCRNLAGIFYYRLCEATTAASGYASQRAARRAPPLLGLSPTG